MGNSLFDGEDDSLMVQILKVDKRTDLEKALETMVMGCLKMRG